MSPLEIVYVTLILIALAAAGYAVRNYGIGFGARSVVCPHQDRPAAISTRWITVEGKSECEVLQCSLLPGGKPVTCDMGCIQQL